MTKPRLSTTRELYGILGAHPQASTLQREMNAIFDAEGIDAFCDRYPTNVDQIPERLSEMFHFDRRAYIVGSKLQEAILPLLDVVDTSGAVDLVLNKGGVLTGYFLGDISSEGVLKFVEANK